MLESLLLSLIFWLFGRMPLSPEPSGTAVVRTRAVVTSVIDGDTIAVLIGSSTDQVRYIGIDTPEPYRDGTPACFSEEATAANKKLVLGQTVTLVSDQADRDQYGRLLRYVYVGDVFVNAELVRGGYATALPIKPNTSNERLFKDLADMARVEARGLWTVCQGETTAPR